MVVVAGLDEGWSRGIMRVVVLVEAALWENRWVAEGARLPCEKAPPRSAGPSLGRKLRVRTREWDIFRKRFGSRRTRSQHRSSAYCRSFSAKPPLVRQVLEARGIERF